MKKITEDLYWVGSLDPDLKVFDIIMETEFGTTYNSYVLKGSEKTALIETSKLKFFDSYCAGLKDIVDLKDVDYVVVNHTEPDHTGTFQRLLDINPKLKLVGSAAAINFMKEITNRDFNFTMVKNGDSLSLGDKTLKFISVPNLHWPDSIFTYVPEIETLFTCDMFGCHYSSEEITNDKIEDKEGYMRALRYYFDNIMGPFKKEVRYAIDQIKDLAIKIIAVGHGPVLVEKPWDIVETYKTWATPADDPSGKKSVVIPYVSAYGYTEVLAKKIEEGLHSAGDLDVQLFDMVTSDKSEVLNAIDKADGILFGTPTIVGEALKPIWDLTTSMFAKIHGGKFASAFGSYGWSGEGVPHIMARLAQLNLKIYGNGLRCRFNPGRTALQEAYELGYGFGNSVLAGRIVPAKKSGVKRIWKCLVCGELVESDEAPAACPVCGVGPEQFIEVEVNETSFVSAKNERFIIIGNGAAGTTAAEEIRRRNKVCSIEILSREDVPAYNRPMLTKGILSDIDDISLYLKPASWYEQNNITLSLNADAAEIETKNKEVRLADGQVRAYDKLIIAAGAESFIPPFPGANLKGVLAIRSLADIRKLQEYLKTAKKAVVIGGGVLGLEAAWELRKAGLDVTVVEGGTHLMLRQLDSRAGVLLQEAATGTGVHISVGHGVSEITGGPALGASGVSLSDGTMLEADLVLLSTGVAQNKSLAEKAGISTDRSIIVDDRMATSAADVFACGDCASYDGKNFGIWMQAIEMGKVAGANAAGDNLRYSTVVPSNAFHGFGTSLFAVGDNGGDSHKTYKTFEIHDAAKGTYEKLYFMNDRFTGGILMGDVSKSAVLLEAYIHESPLDEVIQK